MRCGRLAFLGLFGFAVVAPGFSFSQEDLDQYRPPEGDFGCIVEAARGYDLETDKPFIWGERDRPVFRSIRLQIEYVEFGSGTKAEISGAHKPMSIFMINSYGPMHSAFSGDDGYFRLTPSLEMTFTMADVGGHSLNATMFGFYAKCFPLDSNAN